MLLCLGEEGTGEEEVKREASALLQENKNPTLKMWGKQKKHTLRMTVIKDSVTKSYANALPPNPKRLI